MAVGLGPVRPYMPNPPAQRKPRAPESLRTLHPPIPVRRCPGMPAPKKVLIIGGGFAGLSCAQKLANDNRFEVTLVDRRNHHLFQPLLYQVATASLAAPDIARSLRGILASAANVTVLLD